MILKSLMPNARYDLEHGKPSVFEQDNDGSNLYRYNIEPEINAKGVNIGWQCREIRIWEKPTKAVLKKAVIRSIVDESQEMKMINDYNRDRINDKNNIEYLEYLQFVDDIDSMISNDLKL